MTDTLTFDALALCAAIDGGDDTALPILADWLEEAGDARAAGMRLAGRHRPQLLHPPFLRSASDLYCWLPPDERPDRNLLPCVLPAHVYARLMPPATSRLSHRVLARAYPTRSAAFLALAEALS